MSLNFKSIFDKQAEDNRKTWAHDRTKTVGASEAFQCIRRNYFTKKGVKPDPDFKESYGATGRGSLLEAHYVVPALRSQLPEDSEILWAGDDQITLVSGRLSATPDGLVTNLPRDALKDYGVEDILADSILIEIKTFDPRLKLDEPKPVHAGQVQQQMGLVHEKTNHKPEYAVILYINASWVDDIRVFPIKRDPAIFEVAKKRADMVYDATDAKALMPEGKLKGGAECDYCPFQQQCHLVQVGLVPPANPKGKKASKSVFTPAEDKIIQAKLKLERDLQSKIKEMTAERAVALEEIKQFLRDGGTRWHTTEEGYSVNYNLVKGRTTYDLAKIAQDTGIDLEDYATEGPPSERITVKGPKGDDND